MHLERYQIFPAGVKARPGGGVIKRWFFKEKLDNTATKYDKMVLGIRERSRILNCSICAEARETHHD
jgi:hypothetical protein